MKYANYHLAKFLRKINRFTVICDLDGTEVQAHLKNTGRNHELLVPGYEVSLVYVANPKRQTNYDLVAVNKLGHWVNVDSQAPNAMVKETLAAELVVPGIRPLNQFRPETKLADSRIDFWGQTQDGRDCWLETKGVTLEDDGLAQFPDAPTTRAVKHVHALTQAVKAGGEAYVYFVVQMDYVKQMQINELMAPILATAIKEARAAGVKVIACNCNVTPEEITLNHIINFL